MATTKKQETNEAANEVRLVGRVAGETTVRVLPSGDEVALVRLVVARDEVRTVAGRPGQTVDVVTCAAWRSRPRRSFVTWRAGDVVAVEGALRRRFFRAGGRTAAHVEVEVRTCRVVRRASAG